MSRPEVAIIGGGVIGCSTAFHLAKRGIPSSIYERDAIACQSSGKAWGVVSPPVNLLVSFEGAFVPKGSMGRCLKLSAEGIERFPTLTQELKELGGIDSEYSYLPVIRAIYDEKEERNFRQKVAEYRQLGFELDWLSADEVLARVPQLTPGLRGGTIWPGHQVETYRYTLALAQAAEAKGVKIHYGEAVGFRAKESKVTAVILTKREIEADIFVLAAGPWSASLTKNLGVEFPMKVIREQCLVVESPQKLNLFRVSNSRGCGVAIVPKTDGKIILGKNEIDVVDYDDRPTDEFRDSVLEAAMATMPMLEDARLTEHRSALGTWPAEGGEPVFGKLPGWDNVYIALWLGAFGIQWSPAIGRMLAQMIMEGKCEEAEAFAPEKKIKLKTKLS